MTDEERKNVRNTCRLFVLDYLCSVKGIISYQMITKLNSLELQPENGDFFEEKDFYSTLNEKKYN